MVIRTYSLKDWVVELTGETEEESDELLKQPCLTLSLFLLPLSGPGEEPPDVRCARGGGGAEGADQRVDWAQHSAGAGEQPAQDPGQPRADGSVPGSGPDRWLPDQHRPASGPRISRNNTSPPPHTELRHVCVTQNMESRLRITDGRMMRRRKESCHTVNWL